jgi:hypothetical protein
MRERKERVGEESGWMGVRTFRRGQGFENDLSTAIRAATLGGWPRWSDDTIPHARSPGTTGVAQQGTPARSANPQPGRPASCGVVDSAKSWSLLLLHLAANTKTGLIMTL